MLSGNFLSIGIIFIYFGVTQSFEITCHHYDVWSEKVSKSQAKSKLSRENYVRGSLSDDGRFIRCKKMNRYMVCFAVWIRNGSTISIIKQSCMLMHDRLCRQRTCSRSQYNSHSGMHFCCCFGSYCNTNLHNTVTQFLPKRRDSKKIYNVSTERDASTSKTDALSGLSIVVLAVGVTSVILVSGLVFALVMFKRQCVFFTFGRLMRLSDVHCKSHLKNRFVSASTDSCQTTSTRFLSRSSRQRLLQGESPCDISRLHFTNIIHTGKYGDVWKAVLHNSIDGEESEDIYCVKTFSRGHQRQYFHAERDIYSLSMISNHPNIVNCHGWGTRRSNGVAMIVMEFCPQGSLQAYLSSHVLNWMEFRRISMGAVAGIAHMHSEMGVPGINADGLQESTWSSDERKCPIVHRDINSRNMLVRQNGTLAICDMGFAVKFAPGGNRYYKQDNESELAANCPLQEVGTKRYMAPEVLEGCVDLRECETSLKQVDVYALALVLWEIATRCSSFYPSGQVGPYTVPYEIEAGPKPDVTIMLDVVVKRKCRPLIPKEWSHAKLTRDLLESTLNESWDADPEARISASCILERFKSLPFTCTARV